MKFFKALNQCWWVLMPPPPIATWIVVMKRLGGGWHLLDVIKQGFAPDYTIADGGSGLRAGQKAVMPGTPCHGDVFHIQHQFEHVANNLSRQAKGATSRRIRLEQKIEKARLAGPAPRKLIGQLIHAKHPTSNAYDIGRLMHPVALLFSGWKDLGQCFPNAQRTIANRQLRVVSKTLILKLQRQPVSIIFRMICEAFSILYVMGVLGYGKKMRKKA